MHFDASYIAKLRAQDPPTVEDFLVRCAAMYGEPKRWVRMPYLCSQQEDIIQSALVLLLTAIREGKLPQSSRGIHALIEKTFRDLVRWRIYRGVQPLAQAAYSRCAV